MPSRPRKKATSPSERPRRTDPEIIVTGYKSFRGKTRIRLGDLTLLAGANSAGKSASMQPLLLVKQTLEAPFDPGALLLNGPILSFASARETFWKGRAKEDCTNVWSFRFVDFDGESNEVVFEATKHGIDVSQYNYDPPRKGFHYGQHNVVPPLRLTQRTTRTSLVSQLGSELRGLPMDERLSVTRERCFLAPAITSPESQYVVRLGASTQLMENLATRLIYLPGLRDSPSRFYPATQVGEMFPGPFQPYVASIVASWTEQRDERLALLGKQLADLGLSWKVDAKRLDDTRVALRVGRLPVGQRGGAQDMVNISDVGLGVSQTLPILVALLAAPSGTTVYLEQPEIHLHPRAQVALAEHILQAVEERDVSVICETHSYLLLRALQYGIARRATFSKQVRLNWFSRDRDGSTQIDTTEVDKEGRFDSQWPVDFAEIELDIEDKYLSAVLGQ